MKCTLLSTWRSSNHKSGLFIDEFLIRLLIRDKLHEILEFHVIADAKHVSVVAGSFIQAHPCLSEPHYLSLGW
jgi:hypothetical protein